MAETCRKCGRDVSEVPTKKVADWDFCEPCFLDLMMESEQRKEPQPEPQPEPRAEPEPEPPPAAEPPAAPKELGIALPRISVRVATQASARCDACKQEVEPDQLDELLGFNFCPACHANFAAGLLLAAAGKEEADATPDEPRPPLREQEERKVNAAIPCDGCGRHIKLLGSRERDGQHYCPECFQALPAEEPTAEEPADQSPAAEASPEEGPAAEQQPAVEPTAPPTEPAPAATSDSAAAGRCASCDQPTPAASLATVSGFAICEACRGTDPELALRLARDRHRQRLEQIQRDLETR